MTRKDFNLIAQTIKMLPSSDHKGIDTVRFDALCSQFADALSSTNPRFDRERFIAACNGRETMPEKVSRVMDCRES